MPLPKVGVEAVVDNLDGYEKGIKAITDANDKAVSSVNQTAKDFDKLGKSTDHLGSIFDIAFGNIIASAATKAFDVISGVVGGIINTVGNLTKSIFDNTVTFSQTMANISAVTGETGKGLKEINDQILAVGADSAAGPQKVADAYYDIASGVLDATQRLDTLKAAVAASEAGQADLGATTEFLIAEMNAYGKSAGGATKVSDILTQTVGKGVGKMDDFVHALTPLAGLASANKISLTDMGGAISYMTAKGIPAEQAATQLKAAMTLLARETPQTTRALNAMGEKSIKASIAAHGFGGTLELIRQGAEKTHQNLATLTGSVEALNDVTLLGTDEFAQYFDTFVDGVDGATAKARELQRADVSYQLKLISSRFQAIGIMVGEAVLPAFNKFLTFLNTELANFDWKKIGEGLDKLGEKLGIAAGKIIDSVGKFLSKVDWDKVGTDIETALSDIGEFIANIDWEAVVTGAKDVVTAVGDIVTKVGEIVTAVSKIPGAFEQAAKDAMIKLAPLLSAIEKVRDFLQNPTGLGGTGDNKKPTDTGMAGQTTSNSNANQREYAYKRQDYLNMPTTGPVPSDVLFEAQTAIDAIDHPVQIPTVLAAPTNVNTYGDILTGNTIVKPVQVPTELGKPQNLDVGIGQIGEAAKVAPPVEIKTGLGQPDFGAFAADLAATTEKNSSILTAAGITLGSKVSDGVKGASPLVQHNMGQAVTDSLTAGKTAAAPAGSIGSGMTAGIAAAIRAGGGDVVGALSGVIAEAIAAAKNQLKIQSPSKVFMGIGDQLMAGWEKGIMRNIDVPAMAISGAASMATAAAMPIPLGGRSGDTYNDTRNNTTVYNLGLQPYHPPDNGTNLLQAMRD